MAQRSLLLSALAGTCLAAALLGVAPAHAQGAPELARAEALLRGGGAEDAWKLLAPLEFERAGDPAFDYLLGLAALESGRAALATLIFERVLAVNPGHMAARLDMGRAYFALGDLDRATTELQSVLRFEPPPAARAVIERTLEAIAIRRGEGAIRWTAWAEGSFGRDTNLNSAPAASSLFVPLLNASITLAESSTRQADVFAGIAGGGEVTQAMSDTLTAFVGGEIRARGYALIKGFDSGSSDGRLGLQYARDKDVARVSLGANRYELTGAPYRRAQTLSAEWRRQWDDATQISAYVQDVRQRYVPSASRSQGANLLTGGVGIVRTLDAARRLSVFGSVFRGEEAATDGRGDGDRRMWGGRGGAQGALAADLDWFIAAAWQRSTYSKRNVTFAALRKDVQIDLSGGVVWRQDKDWSIRPQASWTRGHSTLETGRYERFEFSVSLRREWK